MWTPPPAEWVEANKRAMQSALGSLEVRLEPASEQVIRHCLARLALVKPTANGTTAEWKLKAAEYIRLLGHYPADIWVDGCDAAAVECKFFPDPHELTNLLGSRLHDRMSQIRRLKAMLKMEVKPLPKSDRQKIQKALGNLVEVLEGKHGDPGKMSAEQYYDVVCGTIFGPAHKAEMLQRLDRRG